MTADRVRLMRDEGSHDAYISLSSVVAPGVVMCRSGELCATWYARGITFETADDEDIEAGTSLLNTLYRTISRSDYAVQFHRLRRPITDELTPCDEHGFARELSRKYNEKVGHERLMATELYVTLICKQRSLIRKRRKADEIRDELEDRLDEFNKIASQFARSLSRFGVRRLGEYTREGVRFSEQLSLYNFLLTGIMQPVRIPSCPLYRALAPAQVFIGTDMLEIQCGGLRRFMQSVELKDYTQGTFSGILDGLLYPDIGSLNPYVFVETQTFCFLSRNEGQKFLQQQQSRLLSAQDAGVSQIEAMSDAIDGVVNGDFSMGEFSYTLCVFGDDEPTTRKNTQDAVKKLQDEGFLPFVSTLAVTAAWYSQLPCSFEHRPRVARLTSRNFAELAPLHNFGSGKRDGNPWGEALALLQTPSDQPFYFNFHTSPAGENSFDKKTLGNTTVIGTSGSGKTVLLNFMLSMAQKYRDNGHRLTVVFFDKDRGAEIAIRALRGGYLSVLNGHPTGFNPFQLEATDENIQFLIRFMKLLISLDGHSISTYEELNLNDAVKAVMEMPRELRRMGLIPQYLPEGTTREERENSLSKRLRRWVNDGDLAWVFDNPVDELDFNRYPNFGIDGTEFLDNPQVRTPLAYYLLYRMEQVIDGRRFIFVMDEFWKWLLDEAFSDFAFNKLKTIRKQNGLGIFATQSPSDVIGSPIAKAVIEQSATQIFLPNPRADRQDYVEGFKVTNAEFDIIRGLAEDSRMMLIKQGHHSVICRLDLGQFGDELKVLSGSTDNILLTEELRSRYGDDPDLWLPHFLSHSDKEKKHEKA